MGYVANIVTCILLHARPPENNLSETSVMSKDHSRAEGSPFIN